MLFSLTVFLSARGTELAKPALRPKGSYCVRKADIGRPSPRPDCRALGDAASGLPTEGPGGVGAAPCYRFQSWGLSIMEADDQALGLCDSTGPPRAASWPRPILRPGRRRPCPLDRGELRMAKGARLSWPRQKRNCSGRTGLRITVSIRFLAAARNALANPSCKNLTTP